MEPVTVATGAFIALFLLVVLALVIHGSRWTFEHRGRQIEVRSYGFFERIRVDGVAQATERTGSWTAAEHTVALPDGSSLRVRVRLEPSGDTVTCRALDQDGVLVFHSAEPELVPPPAPADPRLAAARTLLADVAKVHPEAATAMERALDRAVLAEQGAATTARAHEALGGDAHEVVAANTRAVTELLEALRALHIGLGTSGAAEVLAEARRAVAHADAAREVDELRRQAGHRARAADRTRAG